MDTRQLDVIMSTPLFCEVDAQTALKACTEHGYTVQIAAGEKLMSAGDAARRLGIILSGAARVYKAAGGKRIFMNALNEGEMIGAAGLFQKDARPVTEVVATKACQVLFFDESELKELFREHFKLTESYLAYLTGRIHFLTARIETMGSPNARDKLLSHIGASAVSGVYKLKAGYNSLADAIGLSRATLYRAMDALEAEGILKRDGNKIIIMEEHVL